MKAKNNYYFRKKVKKGDNYVMKDVKFDPFTIINEDGVSLGELFEETKETNAKINKRLDKIDRFIESFGGVKVEEN